MAFTRTNSGINNQHIFYDVEYIVFVEGGNPISIEDIERNIFNSHSIDMIFWKEILNKIKPSRYKFKAIGSKSALKILAEKITENNLQNILIAMDQEFDMVYNKNINHKNILYTFGYSWENDVWNKEIVLKIINQVTAIENSSEYIFYIFEKFFKKIKFSVSLDGYLFGYNDSLFPRPTGHQKILECNSEKIPLIKDDVIKELIENKNVSKTTIYSFSKRKNICVYQNCYGHLLGDFCKLLIRHFLRTVHNINGLGDEIIRRLALSNFIEHMSDEHKEHYKKNLKF